MVSKLSMRCDLRAKVGVKLFLLLNRPHVVPSVVCTILSRSYHLPRVRSFRTSSVTVKPGQASRVACGNVTYIDGEPPSETRTQYRYHIRITNHCDYD